MQDCGETPHALKRKDKFDLKLGLQKCKNLLKLFKGGIGTLPSLLEPSISKDLSLQARYLISFQKYNLYYFAILLDNNDRVAMQYLKTTKILKSF